MVNDSHKLSDAEIIRRVIEGDVNAFEDLLKRYEQHVLNILKKHIPYIQIEETAQEVFFRAYQGLPTVKQTGSFKQWISAVAIRACYDFWRRQYRSREIPMSDLTERHRRWLEDVISDQSDRSYHENRLQKEASELLDWALGKLSAADRMVFELVYLEGLSGRETANLLGWSVANVKVRSHRCRKKIKKLISEFMAA
jgi:RNA polymerase sigma-70 factor (ECF subfamily)